MLKKLMHRHHPPLKMKFWIWNVRTLTDNPGSQRPEQRTVIISQELRCFNNDISGQNSMGRLKKQVQLKDFTPLGKVN